MTAPDTTATDTTVETPEQTIARLQAELAAAQAAATSTTETAAEPAPEPAPAPAPAGLAIGDFVAYHRVDREGYPVHGYAFVTTIVAPYDRGDGTMTDPQYLVSPLTELGVYLDADQLERVSK